MAPSPNPTLLSHLPLFLSTTALPPANCPPPCNDQTSSKHPLLAVLHPLALIDLLSFAPSLLGALLPEYGVAPWGLDLRWFRVFRYDE